MNFLAIETATDVCSAALFFDNKIADIKTSTEPKAHSKNLAVFVQKIIRKNELSISELDGIAVSSGPGSYTGLRIGFSLVKGMIFPFNLPVIMVPTLHSMEFSICDIENHHVSIHSHRDIIYAQEFKNGNPVSKIINKPIHELNFKKLYGYGLKNRYFSAEYVEVIPSAELIGLAAIEHFDDWIEHDIDKISPNYISSFRIG